MLKNFFAKKALDGWIRREETRKIKINIKKIKSANSIQIWETEDRYHRETEIERENKYK